MAKSVKYLGSVYIAQSELLVQLFYLSAVRLFTVAKPRFDYVGHDIVSNLT